MCLCAQVRSERRRLDIPWCIRQSSGADPIRQRQSFGITSMSSKMQALSKIVKTRNDLLSSSPSMFDDDLLAAFLEWRLLLPYMPEASLSLPSSCVNTVPIPYFPEE